MWPTESTEFVFWDVPLDISMRKIDFYHSYGWTDSYTDTVTVTLLIWQDELSILSQVTALPGGRSYGLHVLNGGSLAWQLCTRPHFSLPPRQVDISFEFDDAGSVKPRWSATSIGLNLLHWHETRSKAVLLSLFDLSLTLVFLIELYEIGLCANRRRSNPGRWACTERAGGMLQGVVAADLARFGRCKCRIV